MATGEVGAKPAVHVWRVKDGVRAATIDDVHVVAITCLAFSADGRGVAAVHHFSIRTTAQLNSPLCVRVHM